ncbi:MAG: hypothetical protein NW200_14220 [Hyphomonadaceae bacterium]|nr:hypothetical protein [Hyphomonadaceae bacterium]
MFDEPIRIFVGADRSQALAVKVLAYSIHRHTDARVDVISMEDVVLPEPEDPRHGSRTLFSFTRFAIPRLAGYRGKAVYMDADMQVFTDIRGLVSIPFDNAKVVIQEELPEEHQPKQGVLGAPKRRIKQCSVMLLDCDRLEWVPEDIIASLGRDYTYEDLLYHLCILEEHEIREGVPFEWNSLETHIPGRTCLTHYTDMLIQPWVSPENPIGWVWLEEVKRMLAEGALTWAALEEEVALGYFRPSLLQELRLNEDLSQPDPERIKRYLASDADAGFVKHREVYERKRLRNRLIKDFEARLAAA